MAELIDRRILRHLRSTESILDVGCGEGRLVTFLAHHTRKQVVGLDISSRRFASATRRQRETMWPNWWSECRAMPASWLRCEVSSSGRCP